MLINTDISSLVFVLFCDERRDVGFKTTSAETHDYETDAEDTNGGVRMYDYGGNGGHDEDDVTDQGESNGVLDCEVATEILICKVGTKERSEVRPETVD